MLNKAKLIEVLDYQAGTMRETVLNETPAQTDESLFLGRRNGRPVRLSEAATTSEFPTLLRDGIKPRFFERYAATPTTWQQIVQVEQSDRMEEDYLKDAGLGVAPIVSENDSYPEVKMDLDSVVTIRNNKRGYIISVTEEMIYFDRIGVIRQIVDKQARSMAVTKQQLVFNMLTTTGNYTRNSTTGDNDVGANTQTLTFSPDNIIEASSIITTAKDRKSGVYLMARPSRLVVGARLEYAAKQLLFSPEIGRGGATNEVYGTGTSNPLRGLVTDIVVDPFMQSFSWALFDPTGGPFVLQQVWPLQMLTAGVVGSPDSYNYFHYDRIEYRVREYYVCVVDYRFAFYSDSTTAPAVD
jgi:phage major head subunit gpT-like protein